MTSRHPDLKHPITTARAQLGEMWGLKRDLHRAELGRLLGLTGRDPGAAVKEWEEFRAPVSGPVSLCITLLLLGAKPPMLMEQLKPQRRG
jgi:hypothetical protein